eukprot:CAMPEP_0180084236 /NCGR_PEP_ID=MMETSP0985-20121206/19746_1 /TAXON_ID=483367 /ORGANISM="non described non described, Strain CCMP 2436" /LENGTH=126 /DNA_ID=CAMNT_0022017869 /DNA_START=525 /DNA_END=902 /DNA_ORIENTATION=-
MHETLVTCLPSRAVEAIAPATALGVECWLTHIVAVTLSSSEMRVCLTSRSSCMLAVMVFTSYSGKRGCATRSRLSVVRKLRASARALIALLTAKSEMASTIAGWPERTHAAIYPLTFWMSDSAETL